MGIEKSYARATISTNLKDDAFHHDHEKLAAVALSGVATGSIGHILFRVKYANDASSFNRLLGEWETIVGVKSVIRSWPQHADHKRIAGLSLNHWLNDVCTTCGGKGHLELMPRVLDDEPCPACKGTGAAELACEKRDFKYVSEMVESLHEMARTAASQAMQKLVNDMDF